MKETDYLALLKKVRRKLSRAHIPAVEAETAIPDSWLRRTMLGDIKRPREGRLTKLAEYFGI